MEFNDELLEEFQRQILLSDIGIEGQMKLFEARILIIGVGSIGTNAFLHLLRSGVARDKKGALGLFGEAKLELADISSQILYSPKDIGKSKLELLKAYAKAYSKGVNVKIHKDEFNFSNLKKVLVDYDLVLDATDNFASKFLINAACVSEDKTLIHAGLFDFNLQLLSIKPFKSACYACYYGVPKSFLANLKASLNKISSKNLKEISKENFKVNSQENSQDSAAPTCAKSAILGSLAGILGALVATQAIKLITGIKESLFDELISFNARDFSLKKESLSKKADCEICTGLFHPKSAKDLNSAPQNAPKSTKQRNLKTNQTQTKEKK